VVCFHIEYDCHAKIIRIFICVCNDFKAYRQQFSQTIVNFFPYFMNFTTAAANQYLIHYHLPIVASHVVLAKILFIN